MAKRGGKGKFGKGGGKGFNPYRSGDGKFMSGPTKKLIRLKVKSAKIKLASKKIKAKMGALKAKAKANPHLKEKLKAKYLKLKTRRLILKEKLVKNRELQKATKVKIRAAKKKAVAKKKVAIIKTKMKALKAQAKGASPEQVAVLKAKYEKLAAKKASIVSKTKGNKPLSEKQIAKQEAKLAKQQAKQAAKEAKAALKAQKLAAKEAKQKLKAEKLAAKKELKEQKAKLKAEKLAKKQEKLAAKEAKLKAKQEKLAAKEAAKNEPDWKKMDAKDVYAHPAYKAKTAEEKAKVWEGHKDNKFATKKPEKVAKAPKVETLQATSGKGGLPANAPEGAIPLKIKKNPAGAGHLDVQTQSDGVVPLHSFKEARKKHTNLMSSDEKSAVLSYSGNNYVNINGNPADGTKGLRKPPPSAENMKKIEKIDAALAKSSFNQAITVHRGVGGKDFYKDLNVGDSYTDLGYVSTSAGGSAAFSSKPVILTIKVPKGYPAAAIPSHHDHENEILLRRNSKFKLTSKKEVGGKLLVEVEVIPDSHLD